MLRCGPIVHRYAMERLWLNPFNRGERSTAAVSAFPHPQPVNSGTDSLMRPFRDFEQKVLQFPLLDFVVLYRWRVISHRSRSGPLF